jgi:hypothetical protein
MVHAIKRRVISKATLDMQMMTFPAVQPNPSIFHHLGAHNTCRRFALAAKEV